MPFDWTQLTGGVVVLFAVVVFYLQFRLGRQGTKGVKNGADLRARIGQNASYTLVQLFAPM